MKRLEDWPARLTAFVAARQRTAFAWGSNDCCLFAADAVEAITGVDAGKPWRGYKTARGALGRVRRGGGVAGLMESAARRHGWAETIGNYAQRGDVVLAQTPDGPALSVRYGHGIVLPGREGLRFLPMSPVARAWKIGSSAIALAKAG